MMRLLRASTLGFLLAALPLMALAQEGTADAASRALPAAGDTMTVAIVTVLVLVGLFVVASLGYLYRRERHLDWDFQRPDTPHHDGGSH